MIKIEFAKINKKRIGMDKKLVTLIIMDGVGMPHNLSISGVLPENTTNLRALAEKYTCGTLEASGEAVGLPADQCGTSEVGHATIGGGRVNYQSMDRINNAIKSGEFAKNGAINAAILNCLNNDKPLHLMGIVSDGGVHSHISHLIELIKIAAERKVKKVYIHFIADGRDTPARSAIGYLDAVIAATKEYKTGEVTDVCGRFYALDRDNNWDRVKVYYDAVVAGVGKKTSDIKSAILESYASGESDEFIKPIIKEVNGKYSGQINEGDSLIIFNFRTDRERQLGRVLSDDNNFDWTKKLKLTLVTMTNYEDSLGGVKVAFDKLPANNILSEVLSKRGYKQLKIAETEKFTHLTFFFNSGLNEPFPNEKWELIASEKLVTYDVKPEMSAREITNHAVKAIKNGDFEFVAINLANGDMVGHSGNLDAARVAVRVVDECVNKICDETLKKGGVAVVTADHGNCDIMRYPDGTPHKAHTMSIVPIIIVGEKFIYGNKNLTGTLADIAPTILKILGEKIPKEMTGKVLFKEKL